MEAAPSEVDAEARRTQAALFLQRYHRRKRDAVSWSTLLKELPKLRQTYMDETAVKAGAAANPLYSDRMLAAREKLREHPRVVEALDAAWEALLPPGRSTLSRKLYYTMARKLYLAAIVQDAESEGEVDTELIDAEEALSTMDADWSTDSAGKPTMEREGFHRCIFQLADMQTGGVGADEYAAHTPTASSSLPHAHAQHMHTRRTPHTSL